MWPAARLAEIRGRSPLEGGIDKLDDGKLGMNFQRTTAAAVVGGTASVIGGGKFANGAVTGAFSRLFNDDAHRRSVLAHAKKEALIGSGKVFVIGGSFRGAGIGKLFVELAIDLIDPEGNLLGYYDVEMSATIGGPGTGFKLGRGTAGVYCFERSSNW